MKSLKYFNSLSSDKQCEFVLDLIENESDKDVLINIIKDGEEQGQNKENFIKLILLLRSLNKGQKTILEELKPLWIKEDRNNKLNTILT